MTIQMMLRVMACGDNGGSALKELALYYGATDFDLSPITDEMAMSWIEGRENND